MKTFKQFQKENIMRGVEDKVRKLHQNASKEGSVKHGKDKYILKFDGSNYKVYLNDKEFTDYTNINTRKISVAKQWLLDYLNN
jgi:hypothetical protein